jgi:hypothetical protein
MLETLEPGRAFLASLVRSTTAASEVRCSVNGDSEVPDPQGGPGLVQRPANAASSLPLRKSYHNASPIRELLYYFKA